MNNVDLSLNIGDICNHISEATFPEVSDFNPIYPLDGGLYAPIADFNPAFSNSDVDSCTVSDDTGSERYSSSPLKSYKRIPPIDILPVTETNTEKRSLLNPNSKGFVPFQQGSPVNLLTHTIELPSSLSERYVGGTRMKHYEFDPFVACFVPRGPKQNIEPSPQRDRTLNPKATSFILERNIDSEISTVSNTTDESSTTSFDTTPPILELNTPENSFVSQNISVSEFISNIGTPPLREIIAQAQCFASFGPYVDNHYNVFCSFCYFIYILSLYLILDFVVGPICQEELLDFSKISFGNLSSLSISDSEFSDISQPEESLENNAHQVLLDLRKKNVNNVIIGTLNINSVASKLDQLRVIIGNYLDILTIQETKLDESVPTADLMIFFLKINV